MRPEFDYVTRKWYVKGLGRGYNTKEDALAALGRNLKTRVVSTPLTEDMYRALVEAAEKRGMTRADLIRMAIQKEVEL